MKNIAFILTTCIVFVIQGHATQSCIYNALYMKGCWWHVCVEYSEANERVDFNYSLKNESHESKQLATFSSEKAANPDFWYFPGNMRLNVKAENGINTFFDSFWPKTARGVLFNVSPTGYNAIANEVSKQMPFISSKLFEMLLIAGVEKSFLILIDYIRYIGPVTCVDSVGMCVDLNESYGGN